MKKIIDDLKKSILYQHKALIRALDMCNMSPEDKKFVLLLNRTNTRTNLTNLQRQVSLLFIQTLCKAQMEDIPPLI